MAFSNTKTWGGMEGTLPKDLLEILEDLVIIQSSSRTTELVMANYLIGWLEANDLDYEIDKNGNILVTKGEAEYYPCIVSHIDTVHQWANNVTVSYEKDKWGDTLMKAFSGEKQVGTGGDDKCGILACMEMLMRFDNIKVVFFSSEEVGCVGSSAVDHSFFGDAGYVIQLDRWGKSDFICKYSGESTVSDSYLEIATPIMKDFGYKKESGLITDSINMWRNGLPLSSVNVSCGYYQHHSSSEYICIEELHNAIEFTATLIANLGEKQYTHKKAPSKTYYSGGKYTYKSNRGTTKHSTNSSAVTHSYPREDVYGYRQTDLYGASDFDTDYVPDLPEELDDLPFKIEKDDIELYFDTYKEFMEETVEGDVAFETSLTMYGIDIEDFFEASNYVQNLVLEDAKTFGKNEPKGYMTWYEYVVFAVKAAIKIEAEEKELESKKENK